jgi:hypothetical protein
MALKKLPESETGRHCSADDGWTNIAKTGGEVCVRENGQKSNDVAAAVIGVKIKLGVHKAWGKVKLCSFEACTQLMQRLEEFVRSRCKCCHLSRRMHKYRFGQEEYA